MFSNVQSQSATRMHAHFLSHSYNFYRPCKPQPETLLRTPRGTEEFPYSLSINDHIGQLGTDLKEGPLDPLGS